MAQAVQRGAKNHVSTLLDSQEFRYCNVSCGHQQVFPMFSAFFRFLQEQQQKLLMRRQEVMAERRYSKKIKIITEGEGERGRVRERERESAL